MNGFAKRSYRSEPAAGSAISSPIGVGRTDGRPALAYRDEDLGWWLWSPCAVCGGTELPLGDRGLVADLLMSDGPTDDASRLAGLLREEDAAQCFCPGCETRRRRLERPGEDPAVWYDTLAGDWVVQVRMPGCPQAVLLPLGVHWFDADWADVYRAASDLAYDDERFAELGASS